MANDPMVDPDDEQEDDTPETPEMDSADDAAPAPLDPTVLAHLQGLQSNQATADDSEPDELAAAQAQAGKNQLYSGLGRAFGTLASSTYGATRGPDSKAYDKLDEEAQAPVTNLLTKQKADAEEVQNQANADANDPDSDKSKAAQRLALKLYPGKLSAEDIANVPASDIERLIYKPAELDEKVRELAEAAKGRLQAKNQVAAAKQSADDEKTQAVIEKELNSLTTSGRSTLGLASKAKVAAQRLKDIVSDPKATNQDLQSAYSDLNAIVSGTATVSGSAHQSYSTASGDLASALQYITGNPQAPDISKIKAHVANVADRMSAISDSVINQQTKHVQSGRTGWIQRNPEAWKGLVDASGGGSTDSPAQNRAPEGNVSAFPPDVLAFAQAHKITPAAAAAIKAKRTGQ